MTGTHKMSPEYGFEAFRCNTCGVWLQSSEVDSDTWAHSPDTCLAGQGDLPPRQEHNLQRPCGPVHDRRAVRWAQIMGANGAEFSDDGQHRLLLWRTMEHRVWAPMLGVIGKNPSTAGSCDELTGFPVDDATTRILKRICFDEGYGGYMLGNLATLIATNPKDLVKHAKAAHVPGSQSSWADRFERSVRHERHAWALERIAEWCPRVLLAWGNLEAPLVPLARYVWQYFRFRRRHPDDLVCLGRTAKGHPRHPLRTKLLGLGSFNPVNSYLPVNVSA